MRMEDVGADLQARTRKLREAGENPDVAPLLDAAKRVASGIRSAAAAAKHSIGVRVVEQKGGVRITVTGPQASRYRAMAQHEMDRLMPGLKAEIRAQITRRAK